MAEINIVLTNREAELLNYWLERVIDENVVIPDLPDPYDIVYREHHKAATSIKHKLIEAGVKANWQSGELALPELE